MSADQSEGQGSKPDAGEATSGEKLKKEPKVWVKPGGSAPAPAPNAPLPADAGASKDAAAAAQPADGPPKKEPKVWTKGAAAAPAAQPAAAPPSAAPPTAAPAKPQGAPPEKKAAVKAEVPSYLDISSDPLVLRLQQKFPGAVHAAQSFLNQKILVVDASLIVPLGQFLKSDPDCGFDLLTDVTALDYPDHEKRFTVVYQLYSIRRNAQVRLKCQIAEHQEIASVTSVWETANWLEREVFDMFGIVFAGHPDLRRILLPEDWTGFPLRKDYDLRKQDEDWIRRHLEIRK